MTAGAAAFGEAQDALESGPKPAASWDGGMNALPCGGKNSRHSTRRLHKVPQDALVDALPHHGPNASSSPCLHDTGRTQASDLRSNVSIKWSEGKELDSVRQPAAPTEGDLVGVGWLGFWMGCAGVHINALTCGFSARSGFRGYFQRDSL